MNERLAKRGIKTSLDARVALIFYKRPKRKIYPCQVIRCLRLNGAEVKIWAEQPTSEIVVKPFVH
jgi:hypothetical protein